MHMDKILANYNYYRCAKRFCFGASPNNQKKREQPKLFSFALPLGLEPRTL